jgi:hypothetical protein
MHGTDHTVLPLSLDEIRDIIPTVQARISASPSRTAPRLRRIYLVDGAAAYLRSPSAAMARMNSSPVTTGYAAATLIERFGWFARTPLYGRPARSQNVSPPARRRSVR